MRRLTSITMVIGALLATMAMTASAASTGPADIPACEELLTVRQAKVAMRETTAFILGRQVEGQTRLCYYAGGSTGAIRHSIGVHWGPYADARKWMAAGELTNGACAWGKDACRALKNAAKLRSNLKSFAALADALDRVGSAKRLQAPAFEGNPAVLWVPSEKLETLDQLAWVFVYDVRSAHLLLISCTSTDDKAADIPCSLAAAKQAYTNIS